VQNIVFLELYRRMNNRNFQINYWKEYGKAEGMEMDSVINSRRKVDELINVTYAGSETEIREREKNLY
jgi:predicted AAA+ superfamily ATPase